MEIFKVFGSLIIEDKDAIKSLNDADKKAKDTAVSMHNLTKKAAEVGKAVAIGAGVAVTALFGLATKASQTTDRIDKMSQQLGMSRTAFQEWDYILGQNGVSMDSMNTAMKSMTTAMSSLAEEGNKGQDTLGKLGVSVEDLKKMKQEDIFKKAVIALQGMDDGYEKARLAQQLFGKQGQEMLPMLNQSKGSIEELTKRAHDLGLVLNDESVTAGVIFGDTLDDLKKSFSTIVAEIGVQVMPIFQRFANWIISNMPTIKTVAGGVLNGIANAIEWVSKNAGWLIPVLASVVSTLTTFSVLTSVSSGLKLMQDMLGGATLKMGLFNGVMAANPIGMVALAIGVLVAAIAVLWMNWDKVSQFFTSTFKTIQEGFEKFINGFINGLNWLIEKANQVPGIEIKKIGNVDIGKDNGKNTSGAGTFYQNTNKNDKYSKVGAFADGGIAYGDTLARVGEYAGVKNNPEVIAPLDKLKGMLGNSMDYELLADLITDRMTKAMQKIAIVLDHTEVGTFVDKRIIRAL